VTYSVFIVQSEEDTFIGNIIEDSLTTISPAHLITFAVSDTISACATIVFEMTPNCVSRRLYFLGELSILAVYYSLSIISADYGLISLKGSPYFYKLSSSSALSWASTRGGIIASSIALLYLSKSSAERGFCSSGFTISSFCYFLSSPNSYEDTWSLIGNYSMSALSCLSSLCSSTFSIMFSYYYSTPSSFPALFSYFKIFSSSFCTASSPYSYF